MDKITMFCNQLGLLNQLMNQELVSPKEYNQVKEYIMKKYNIGVYEYDFN